ncbi:MAG TPA: hypothetical protein VK935_01000 [Actinomycetospora sp.]|nr:hypothetical protein [Actinomycetospora sp.]
MSDRVRAIAVAEGPALGALDIESMPVNPDELLSRGTPGPEDRAVAVAP